jgi:hypothetical protein
MEKLLNYFKRLVGYEDNYVPATHPPLVRMNAQTNLLNEDNKLSDKLFKVKSKMFKPSPV